MSLSSVEAGIRLYISARFAQGLDSLTSAGPGRPDPVHHGYSTPVDPTIVHETVERIDSVVTTIAADNERARIKTNTADTGITVAPIRHGKVLHRIEHLGQASPDIFVAVPRPPHRNRNGASHTVFHGESHDANPNKRLEGDVAAQRTTPSIHIPRPR